jgi:hypothetical protein
MKTLDFSDIANIATTLGFIISTLTLISAYQLYKIGRRDHYIKEVRNTLITFQYNSLNLNNLLSFDISHELVNSVVYSKQIDRQLNKIYSKYFEEDVDKTRLIKYLKYKFLPITVSIHSDLLKQFDTILKHNSQEASKIYTDYPSLYRVYEAVNSIFDDTIRISKNIVRDEDMFRDIIVKAFLNKKKIKNVEDLKDYIFYEYMGIVQDKHNDDDQPDINDALDILILTTQALMRLTDKELFCHRKKEKNLHLKAANESQNIFEDLLEAEKGLKFIMKEDELLLFREYSTKIKVRNIEKHDSN